MNALKALNVGEKITVNGNYYEITNLLNLESCLAKEIETGKLERLFFKDIQFENPRLNAEKDKLKKSSISEELSQIDEKDWQEALRRFSFIKPLLENPARTRRDVENQAKLAGMSSATLYRLIKQYEMVGKISALIPTKKDGGKNKSRLTPECEIIVEEAISNIYLTTQKNRIEAVIREVRGKCLNAKIKPPHPNTVRNRIAALEFKDKEKKRHGKKAAQKFNPAVDKFPEGKFPLDVVQIDHTPLDIILVDEVYRESIGKPWITMAIDVFSRMVVGIYVSLDPPGSLSVGMCLANAILPKDNWLTKLGVEMSWNVWGLPRKIHADNAKEFRGEMIQRACQQYGVDLEWRPVANPKYGGHIERLLGTFATEIHSLPGTTFSNVSEKGDYDSEKNAIFTLPEFEKWLCTLIIEAYHQRLHTSLKTSPVKKFELGIFGAGDTPGIGIPPRITNEERLKIDFMPMVTRTVKGYGIVIDEIHYYHDVLRPHLNLMEDEEKKIYKKFICRRDPRDISVIYFFDPDLNRYFPIPYRNVSHPAISLWELREITRKLKDEGYQEIDETLIFNAYHKMQSIKEMAQRMTKKVRREQSRKKYHNEIEKPYQKLTEEKFLNKNDFSTENNNDDVEFIDSDSFRSENFISKSTSFDDFEEYD